MRILIIDDDRDLLFALKDALSSEGVDVTVASDGAQGITAMREGGPFDVVFLDWMMPRMSGADVLTSIEHDDGVPRSRIVVLTGAKTAEMGRFQVEVARKPVGIGKLLGIIAGEAAQ
jgi:DNA-binding response OmpR family regulator